MATREEKWPKLPPMMKQIAPNGTTYVYTGKSVWDPVKKRPMVKNKTSCGKLFNDQVVFSRKFLAKHPELIGYDVRHDGKGYVIVGKRKAKLETLNAARVVIKAIGATHLFEELARQTNLRKTLEEVFPKKADDILSCVYLMLLAPHLSWTHFDVLKKQLILPSQLDFTQQQVATLVNDIAKQEKACASFLQKSSPKSTMQQLYAVANTNGSTFFCDDSLHPITYGLTNHLAPLSRWDTSEKPIAICSISEQSDEQMLYDLFVQGQQIVRVPANFELLSTMRKQAHRSLWFAQGKNKIKTGPFQSWFVCTQQVEVLPKKGRKGGKVFAHLFVNRVTIDSEKRQLMYQLQQILDKKTQLDEPQEQMDLFKQDHLSEALTDQENFLFKRYIAQKADKSYFFLEEQIMDDVIARCGFAILSSTPDNAQQVLEFDVLRQWVEQTDYTKWASYPLLGGVIDSKGWLFLQSIALIFLVTMFQRFKANQTQMKAKEFSITRMIQTLNSVFAMQTKKRTAITQLTREQILYYRLMNVRIPVA